MKSIYTGTEVGSARQHEISRNVEREEACVAADANRKDMSAWRRMGEWGQCNA